MSAALTPLPTAHPADTRRPHRLLHALRRHHAVAIVIGLFLATVFVVPIRANVAVLDDWVYIKEAQHFARHLDLHVRDEAAANSVFEAVWGGLFGVVLGTQLWVFRLSTVVLSLLGGLAMYGLCRELGVGRNGSAFGAALLLFNPLYFVLSYTFMTDAHLTALVTMSAFAYARGLREDRRSSLWTWTGSALAAAAYLCRPQGALLPAGVIAFLLATRQLHLDRASLRRVSRVALVPAVVLVAHQLWLHEVNGVPTAQESFLQELGHVPAHELGALVVKLGYAEANYFGLFLLPLLAAVVVALVRKTGPTKALALKQLSWLVLGGWIAALIAGRIASHQLMPLIPSWFTRRALGSDPLVIETPDLLSHWGSQLLMTGALIGAALGAYFVIRAFADRATSHRRQAGLVVALLVFQALGAVAPSVAFRAGVSFDRYILPMFPLAFAIVLWSCRGLKPVRTVVVVGLVITGAFAVAGTHDSLSYEKAIWQMDHHALKLGVPEADLDGGAGWTRYHRAGKGDPVPFANGAVISWWVDADRRTSSRFIVAPVVVGGYRVVAHRKVHQWIRRKPLDLYLLELVPPAG